MLQVEAAEVKGELGAQAGQERKDVVYRLSQSGGRDVDPSFFELGERAEPRLVPLGDLEAVPRGAPLRQPVLEAAGRLAVEHVIGALVGRPEGSAHKKSLWKL
jgi:hypothetical protein